MHCKHCGVPITGKEEFCANCGETVAKSKPSAPGSASLSGVGGWLLLLCIFLTIVFPLNILYGTVRSLRYHPDTVVWLLNGINLGMGILSLAAGLMLWRVRHYAVMVTKVFLVASPLHAVGIFCLVLSSGHITALPAIVTLALRILALPFLFSLIWFWYLMESKRVRDTYTVG